MTDEAVSLLFGTQVCLTGSHLTAAQPDSGSTPRGIVGARKATASAAAGAGTHWERPTTILSGILDSQ